MMIWDTLKRMEGEGLKAVEGKRKPKAAEARKPYEDVLIGCPVS